MFGISDSETWLEMGFVALGVSILVGIAALFYGRARVGAQHAGRQGQNAPHQGSVSSERHRNIQTVAAR